METSMNKTTFKATQRVFTEAYKHIIAQGEPAYDPVTQGCVYRLKTEGDQTLSCAFAPCIRDYEQAMEDTNAGGLLDGFSDNLYAWVRKADGNICNLIQAAHDDPARTCPIEDFIDDFKFKMHRIAEKYNFEIPEVEE